MPELGGGDAALWTVVERGLAKSREDRFASVAELGEALALWLFGHGIKEDLSGNSIRAVWLEPTLSGMASAGARPPGGPPFEPPPDFDGEGCEAAADLPVAPRPAPRSATNPAVGGMMHRWRAIAFVAVLLLFVLGGAAWWWAAPAARGPQPTGRARSLPVSAEKPRASGGPASTIARPKDAVQQAEPQTGPRSELAPAPTGAESTSTPPARTLKPHRSSKKHKRSAPRDFGF
jgi:hypothetical protein